MRPTTRFRLSVLAVLAALLAPLSAAAIDNACWNRAIERLDYYTNPPESGDNQFFTAIQTQNEQTNVTLLYPTSSSLKQFMLRLYRIRVDLGGAQPTGCTNAYMNSLTYFMPTNVTAPAGPANLQGPYVATNSYPNPEDYSGGYGTSDNVAPASAYRFGLFPTGGANSGTPEAPATACGNLPGLTSAQKTDCTSCLSTAGYWLNPNVADNDVTPNAGVFMGNWLRFNPPKWQLLRLAYRRLVNGPLLSTLREGVMAENGATGGKIVQKMLPQSCNGTGRPINQKQAAVDSLDYSNAANPISEMIFNTAWFMGGQDATWFFDQNGQSTAAAADGKSGPCNACNGDFMVLFSDGRSDAANPGCTPNLLGVTPAWCRSPAQCQAVGLGPEGDGNDFLNPPLTVGAGKTGPVINGPLVAQTPAGTCDNDWADDVARWAANNDTGKSYPGSHINTYVVGIGDKNNTYGELTPLKEIAKAGNGEFIIGSDFASLEAGIEYVIGAIIRKSTSFSSTAVAPVQSRGVTSAFVPRFRPLLGANWWGDLMRFQLFNEFAAGCSTSDYGKVTTANPNGNSSCTDFYLQDLNGDFVSEDAQGNFAVMDTTKTWTSGSGWPLKTNPDGSSVLARPVWDAAAALTSREDSIIAGTSTDERKILTVYPNGGKYNQAPIPFNVSNVGQVTPLLSLDGVYGDACSTLGVLTRHTYTTEADCATDLILFMHGRDVLRQNPYNRTIPAPLVQKSRPNILADLFHSSPVAVSPPTPGYLCNLGIVNQCTYSLLSPTLTPNGLQAYSDYFTANQYRTQVVLVGANDGMLHAFNGSNDVVDGLGRHSWDLGTGREMWAFIPPDMLPKLQRYVIGEQHQLLVDGSPFVRDVWVDGSGSPATVDGKKQADEYHTLAIVGEREGGRSYFALDVSKVDDPKFLWSWPPPGTTDALYAGESWNDVLPGSPPVGPVAIADTNGPLTIGGVKAKERYVLATGGGWDPALLRGRGIYVVDAWTGDTLWRFARRDTTDNSDLRSKLWPVTAAVSLIDSNADGLFDTMVAPDTGGQVWTVSMMAPGKDTNADGSFDNWYAARGFHQFRGDLLSRRSPFFQPAAVAQLDTGDLRVMLGSGTRDQAKDPNGGSCSLINLPACIKNGCSVDVQAVKYRIGPTSSGYHQAEGRMTYTAGNNNASTTVNTDSLGQQNQCADVIDADLEYTINCTGTNVTFSNKAYCDWAATTAVDCPVDTGRPPSVKIADNVANIEYTRFYSYKLFGSGNRARFTTQQQADDYDAARLTDSDLVDASTTQATATSNGWYLTHVNSRDEKTASGSLLMGGCVLWNTLTPNPSQAVACGTTTLPPDTAYTYQADAISGAVSCGQAGSSTFTQTQRFTSRATNVIPQQASPVISINTQTNQVNYGGLTIEPGRMPLSVTMGTGDGLGTIHWLEVPRKMHDCRHNGQNCQQ